MKSLRLLCFSSLRPMLASYQSLLSTVNYTAWPTNLTSRQSNSFSFSVLYACVQMLRWIGWVAFVAWIHIPQPASWTAKNLSLPDPRRRVPLVRLSSTRIFRYCSLISATRDQDVSRKGATCEQRKYVICHQNGQHNSKCFISDKWCCFSEWRVTCSPYGSTVGNSVQYMIFISYFDVSPTITRFDGNFAFIQLRWRLPSLSAACGQRITSMKPAMLRHGCQSSPFTIWIRTQTTYTFLEPR